MEVNLKMLAYCGLYCEQCSFKAAHDEQNAKHIQHIPYAFVQRDLSQYSCECCKGFCICGSCKIKPCAAAKHIDSCAQCSDFPCELIDAFATDGKPHHAQAVQNLHDIRTLGLESWYKQLSPSLTCACGQRQTWYYTCPCHSHPNP